MTKNLQNRHYKDIIKELALKNSKMAFISGPRQSGKTTLAKLLMSEFKDARYYNWDETDFRKKWTKSPNTLFAGKTSEDQKPIIVLDEIHKAKSWKRTLKGVFDTIGENFHIIVTGSARLNIYKKGSDSLMGRYLNFRLYPLSVGELINKVPGENEDALSFLNKKVVGTKKSLVVFQQLLQFSGFPEPYLKKSNRWLNIWRKGRLEKVIREDLRDLSRLNELSQVEMLCSLLPDRVGSPLSLQSLREDLEVSHHTVKRWINYLKELFYLFELKPYAGNNSRSLKKEGKIYLYDWTEIDNQGARFENLVAVHLLKACHFWEDTGEGNFQLSYLRNKEKKEVDFIILKNKKPWLTIECKLSADILDTSYKSFRKYAPCPHIQLVSSTKVFRKIDEETYVISADAFLAKLP